MPDRGAAVHRAERQIGAISPTNDRRQYGDRSHRLRLRHRQQSRIRQRQRPQRKTRGHCGRSLARDPSGGMIERHRRWPHERSVDRSEGLRHIVRPYAEIVSAIRGPGKRTLCKQGRALHGAAPARHAPKRRSARGVKTSRAAARRYRWHQVRNTWIASPRFNGPQAASKAVPSTHTTNQSCSARWT